MKYDKLTKLRFLYPQLKAEIVVNLKVKIINSNQKSYYRMHKFNLYIILFTCSKAVHLSSYKIEVTVVFTAC